MKKVLLPIILLLLCVGCRREATLPEATSAAKEIYLQYADSKDYTVALIGGYQGYNAVMLQAQNADDWLRLCEDFGVCKDIDASALDSTRVSSLMTVSHSGGVIRNVDSVFAEGDELLQRVVDSVMQDILRSGKMSGRVVIDTVFSSVRREHYENGSLVDSSTIANVVPKCLDNNLLHMARQHGDCGYIIRDDSEALTLWLFFYSNNDEKEQILNHVTSRNLLK